MSSATEPVTAFTFIYCFPSEEEAELAPQTLGEVIDAFDGRAWLDMLEDDVLGCSVVLRAICDPDALATLTPLEPGLAGLLDNWASSSGGHRVG